MASREDQGKSQPTLTANLSRIIIELLSRERDAGTETASKEFL